MRRRAVKSFAWGSVAGIMYVGWDSGPGTALWTVFTTMLTALQVYAIARLVFEDIEL